MIEAYGAAHVWKTLRKSAQGQLKKNTTVIVNNLPLSSTNKASKNTQPTEQHVSQQEICGEGEEA